MHTATQVMPPATATPAVVLVPAIGAAGAAAALAVAMAIHNLVCGRVVLSRLDMPFLLAFAR